MKVTIKPFLDPEITIIVVKRINIKIRKSMLFIAIEYL